MGKYHLPNWLMAAITASGGFGLLLVGFLDSSFLPIPSINDLLLIDLCIRFPLRMPYYAAMSTVGSLAGSMVLFFIARKGGEAAFHKRAGLHGQRVHRWMERNGFVTLLVAALLPPPTPFKVFVLAAGVLEMPTRSFLTAMIIARGIRFFGEGYLAIRYGNQAAQFLAQHKLGFAIGALALVAVLYLIFRLIVGRTASPGNKGELPG
jgi:membrane protein YqaA with SNARE-associated domain